MEKLNYKCCVLGCTSRSSDRRPGVAFHPFPKDYPIKKTWNMATNRNRYWCPSKSSRICSKHFSDDQFSKKSSRIIQLKPTAVPTVTKPLVEPEKNEEVPDEGKPPEPPIVDKSNEMSEETTEPSSSDSESTLVNVDSKDTVQLLTLSLEHLKRSPVVNFKPILILREPIPVLSTKKSKCRREPSSGGSSSEGDQPLDGSKTKGEVLPLKEKLELLDLRKRAEYYERTIIDLKEELIFQSAIIDKLRAILALKRRRKHEKASKWIPPENKGVKPDTASECKIPPETPKPILP